MDELASGGEVFLSSREMVGWNGFALFLVVPLLMVVAKAYL